ncbi:MAG: DUF3857 domain-containing protein [Saprospiraceae bacterium]
MKFLTIISFCFLTIASALGKSVPGNPMKWGKIPAEDLKMKTYAADTEADAVVLGEYGNIEYFVDEANRIKYKFTVHRRVKILKESAIDRYSDVEIDYYVGSSGIDDKVKGIKAQSFTTAGSRQTLSKKDIYSEEYNKNYSIKKFSIPNVQVGSVIEYKYVKETFYAGIIPTWYFQQEIPVRISRYNLKIMSEYQFVQSFNGRVVTTGENTYLYQGVSKLTIADGRSYTMENLQAVDGERYITTLRDYMASISFYLESVNNGGTTEVRLGTWENFAEQQRKDKLYGKQYLERDNYKDLLAAASPILKKKGSTEKETVRALYEFINRTMNWNESYYYAVRYRKESLDAVFADKKGSSGELNLMLLALLREAGIKADPVMISTRGHGKVSETYPLDDQFNHVLVHAMVDGKPMFLDTNNKYRPIGYPRFNALNRRGWILKENSQAWIDIPAQSGSDVYLVTAKLDADGTLAGMMQGVYQGYAGVSERRRFKKNGEHWKNRLIDKYPEVKIDSVKFENFDNVYKPFKDEIHWRIPEAAQVSGDLIYISPAWFSDFSENPFKQEKRAYPVDIGYPLKEQLVVNLELPEGYVVEDLPEPVNLALPNKGGKFQYFIKEKNGTLQLVSKLSLKQLVFEPSEYEGLKKIFDVLVEKHSEQLVLKKVK